MRLVDDSAFRVDVAVPTELTLDLVPGRTLTVAHRGRAAIGAPTEATIRSIASVADAGSSTRLVRLELANPTRLPAGLTIDVLVPTATEPVAVGGER
jgi:multidrug efflux pump subunit AcrA (membrane-fusion protein)